MMKFAFYDTETTGAEPRFDQVLQAAAILTDDDFQEIESFDVRSRLAAHIVPSAGALKVTGVDPREIARAPYTPYAFARFLHQTFDAWGQGGCVYTGFNTIRFDEEIMRQAWWESLHDPYLTSRKGSVRADVLTMLRAIYARNPELIDIPTLDTGKRTFRLEHVAPLNGFEGHDAHDALGDVRATIHVMRLIRDCDPDLFQQMLATGDARSATDFADQNIVFRMLGGQALNPGILDVCLIASEADNPKSKSAWNLAVDPTPYLDLDPEAILEAMRKSGTPFRTLKTNKAPALFPINWEFLNHAAGEEAADPVTIDMRAEMIRSHDGFQKSVAEALRLKTAGYEAPKHLEEKIYAGFPSWEDKRRMAAWHGKPTWEARVDAMRAFEKPELRALALRTIFVNAPEALPPHLRDACAATIAEQRHGLSLDMPWNTVGTLMAEIDEMLEADPENAEALNIRAWALETYPKAREWTGVPKPAAADDAATGQPEVDTPADTADAGVTVEIAVPSDAGEISPKGVAITLPDFVALGAMDLADGAASEGDAMPAPRPAAVPVHFLDGLD